MFHTTLIGLQDVPSGLEGFALAQRLSPEAQMTLVRVHRGYRVVASGVSDARANAERGLAASDLARLSRTTGVTDTLSLGAKSIGEGLAEAARQRDGDLLVLSADQILAGRENLLTPLSLLTIPIAISSAFPLPGAGPVSRIGMVHDRSPESEQALTIAREVAAGSSAALTGFDISQQAGLSGAQAASLSAQWITAFAETVDLLVLALRPQRLGRRPLGTETIEEVIASSSKPVMLVPPGATVRPPQRQPPSEVWVAPKRNLSGPHRSWT